MDAQLKQRLTGAVILVLLAVLLVPELLRGPREPAPAPGADARTDAADEAGGEGAPLRSYEIDLSDEPRATDDAAEAADPPGGSSASPESPGTPAPATAAAPRPEAPRSAQSPARDSASGPADAGLPQRGFAVQVGSFASRDGAERLASELRSRRFETFVAPVRSGGRQLYRVRVGPVADRGAAQALAARLKSAGQKGSVVTLP